MPQEIRLLISSLKTAGLRIANQPSRIQDQNHALRVIENVLVEIALASIPAFRLAAVTDVLRHMNRTELVVAPLMKARCRHEIRPVSHRKYKLLVQRSWIPAKWASSRLHARSEQLELSHIPPNRLRRLNFQQIRQRAIKSQHSIVRVMHDNEIRDRVKILHPLFPRPLNSR